MGAWIHQIQHKTVPVDQLQSWPYKRNKNPSSREGALHGHRKDKEGSFLGNSIEQAHQDWTM